MPAPLNTNRPSAMWECDLEERVKLNKTSNLLSKSDAAQIPDQFNVALVQQKTLTQGWRTRAAPEGQTGSQGGSGSWREQWWSLQDERREEGCIVNEIFLFSIWRKRCWTNTASQQWPTTQQNESKTRTFTLTDRQRRAIMKQDFYLPPGSTLPTLWRWRRWRWRRRSPSSSSSPRRTLTSPQCWTAPLCRKQTHHSDATGASKKNKK